MATFSILPGHNDGDYIITLEDGRVLVIDGVGTASLDTEDGVDDGIAKLTVDGDSTDGISEFFSGTGETFSVAVGPSDDDYILTMGDGTVIVIDQRNLNDLDAEDGAFDGRIDVDTLVDLDSGDGVSRFFSTSGDTFSVASGPRDDSYLITLSDGSVIVIDSRNLNDLDSEDGTVDGVIDIDTLVDANSGDGVSRFFSTSGDTFSVASGPNDDDYLITLSDGTVIVIDSRNLNNLDQEDGTTDGLIDIDTLVDADSGDNVSQFFSTNGDPFTVTAGPGDDDYLITLSDGTVIVIDSRNLNNLDQEDGTTDGLIDIDTLVDADSGDGVSRFFSTSGDPFSVVRGVADDDYLITLSDGSIIVVDQRNLNNLDQEDGTTDGLIDIDTLVDGDSGDGVSQFYSTTGLDFTILPGPTDDDYIILVDGGQTIFIDAANLDQLDKEDGTVDGVLDIDVLVNGSSDDRVSEFFSTSGDTFTVEPGPGDDDYLITLSDGTTIVVDSRSLKELDREDGAFEGRIDVDTLVDADSGDNVSQFFSTSGDTFTVAQGPSDDDYLITLSDGTVIVVDQRDLNNLDPEDGTTDGRIDVDTLVDADSSDRVSQFFSTSGDPFTVAAGPGDDDYLVTLSDGTVIVVDQRDLNNLDPEDGTTDGRIDIDTLVDADSGDGVARFFSTSGDTFTVAAGPRDDSYLVTLSDGSVIVVDQRSLSDLDSEDGTVDGSIDIDTLVDADSGDGVSRFFSTNGDPFTVAAGPSDDDYLITLSDGSVIVVDQRNLNDLDAEDGTVDGSIDIDTLVDADSGDNVSQFFSTSGDTFTVVPGKNDDDYLITLSDGSVIVIDGRNLSDLDSEDGSGDGRIDIDSLVDGDSGDGVSRFFSSGGNPFTVEPGPGDDDYLITLSNGNTIVIDQVSLASLDEGDLTVDGQIDIDSILDIDSNDNIIVICFTENSLIETDKGEVAASALKIGDKVKTLDNGYQELLWVGSRHLTKRDLISAPHLTPIRIRKGALGHNMPVRDLLLSPQHRVLVRSRVARRMFDTEEVLLPVNKLLKIDGIDIAYDVDDVTYVHFMCDEHQIVWSDGALTESLFLGSEAMKSLPKKSVDEIREIFPNLLEDDFEYTPARKIPEKGKLMKKLVYRIDANGRDLYESL